MAESSAGNSRGSMYRPANTRLTESGNSRGSMYRPANTRLTERDHIKQLSSFDAHPHKRILIVDDNPDITFTLRIGLENDDASMQVYSYNNPVNALLDFRPDFYDLLLIDVNMPLMNGFELCEKLLQKDINVKVCFMTSGEINMDAVREVHPLKSVGCFIKKPITTDALVRRIRAELE